MQTLVSYTRRDMSGQRATWWPLRFFWLAPVASAMNFVWEVAQMRV